MIITLKIPQWWSFHQKFYFKKKVTLIIERTRILRCKNWLTVYKHLTDWYARYSLKARFRRHNSHEPNRATTNFGWPILISAECDERLSRSKFEWPFRIDSDAFLHINLNLWMWFGSFEKRNGGAFKFQVIKNTTYVAELKRRPCLMMHYSSGLH